MIANKEKCDSSNKEETFSSSSTNHNQIAGDTKIQRIVKTLLIDISFAAMVSKILVQKFHQLYHF